MTIFKRTAKNAGILFASGILAKMLNFFYTVSMARYLGAEFFGILSFAMAFALIFAVFADLGLQTLSVREIARNKTLTGKYLRNIAAIKLILGFIVFIFIIIVLQFIHYPFETTYVIYLISLSVLVNSFNNMFYAIYQAHEKMRYIGIAYVLNSILMFFGVIAFIYLKLNIVDFAYVYLLSAILILIFNLINIVRGGFIRLNITKNKEYKIENKIENKIDFNFWKNLLKNSIPFGLTSIFVIIYFKIDSVMLGIMKTAQAVGYYNAAYRLIDVFTALFPAVIFSAIFPVMSRYLGFHDKLKKIYIFSFKLSFFIGAAVSIATMFLAKYIILIIYGFGYNESSMPLKILVWAFFLICLSSVTSGLLSSVNKQKIVTIGAGMGAFVNVGLNFFLIPYYSLNGSAIATVITELFMLILYISQASKFLKIDRHDLISMFKISKKDIEEIKNLNE